MGVTEEGRGRTVNTRRGDLPKQRARLAATREIKERITLRPDTSEQALMVQRCSGGVIMAGGWTADCGLNTWAIIIACHAGEGIIVSRPAWVGIR